VLRRLARQGIIDEGRASEAVRDLLDLRIHRYPHFEFLVSIWQLRNNLSAYDAAYVVLARELEATLITRDHRLTSASGNGARIEIF